MAPNSREIRQNRLGDIGKALARLQRVCLGSAWRLLDRSVRHIASLMTGSACYLMLPA
jgi:hypothetical protein